MALWRFPQVTDYGLISDEFFNNQGDADNDLEGKLIKVLEDNNASDDDGNPIMSGTHKIKFTEDKDKKKMEMIRSDPFNSLDYLDRYVTYLSDVRNTEEQRKKVLLGLILMSKCR